MKKEYSKLHDRYTELFKTHIDYMERTKSILGTERLDQLGPGAARPRIAGMALNQLNRFVTVIIILKKLQWNIIVVKLPSLFTWQPNT